MTPTPTFYRAASKLSTLLGLAMALITFYLLQTENGYVHAAIGLLLCLVCHCTSVLLANKAKRLDEDQHVIMHELDLG